MAWKHCRLHRLWPFAGAVKLPYPVVSSVARAYAIFTAHLLPEEQLIILEKRGAFIQLLGFSEYFSDRCVGINCPTRKAENKSAPFRRGGWRARPTRLVRPGSARQPSSWDVVWGKIRGDHVSRMLHINLHARENQVRDESPPLHLTWVWLVLCSMLQV